MWSVLLLLSLVSAVQAEVMAIKEENGEPVEAEKIESTATGMSVVDKKNARYEFSPHSVFEFTSDGDLRLLRGSVIAVSKIERKASTPTGKINFIGRSIISYDHREKSSSVFVAEGQSRLINPGDEDSTILIDRFHGASLASGETVPKMVKQIDVGAVDEWLSGYSWSKEKRTELLRGFPVRVVEKVEAPEYLKNTKLDDYFASVEPSAADNDQPEYYDKKFGDQDKVVLEANAEKDKVKVLSPEQAALITLPDNKIDLDLDLPIEVLNAAQKREELGNLNKAPSRGLASIEKPKPMTVKKNSDVEKKVVVKDVQTDGVSSVLERLRSIKNKSAANTSVYSQAKESTRSPASEMTNVVPDPVYDFSQNF